MLTFDVESSFEKKGRGWGRSLYFPAKKNIVRLMYTGRQLSMEKFPVREKKTGLSLGLWSPDGMGAARTLILSSKLETNLLELGL